MDNDPQNSILNTPLQVGSPLQGSLFGAPQQTQMQAQTQASPQGFFNQAQGFTQGWTPEKIHRAFTLDQKRQQDLEKLYADYQKDSNESENKRLPGKRSLSDIFFYGVGPEAAVRFQKDQSMKRELADQDYTRKLTNLVITNKYLAGLTPEELKAQEDLVKGLSTTGKEHAEAMKALRESEGAPELKAAQAHHEEALAQSEPTKIANEAQKTQIEAGKTYLDFRKAEMQYQKDPTKENWDRYKEAIDLYEKGVAANSAIQAQNREEIKAQTETTYGSDNTPHPKYPGYKAGKPRSLLPLQASSVPPGITQAYNMQDPQVQNIMNMLAGQTGIPPIKGQAGQLANTPTPTIPAPTTPRPSLVGPQQPTGNMTPNQVAGNLISQPPTQAGIAGNVNPSEGINPTDIPLPISLQTSIRTLPPGFKAQGESIAATFQQRVADNYPEAKELTMAIAALSKLTGKK